MNVSARDRAVKTSAWVLYTLIVLEILFMVSPFAAYYYSIYATPLNALQEFQSTAWLTMYVLPHFTYSDSWLANGLILISWPLILLGVVLFVLGFCQIYWSKFTGKGAVEVGLYRFIRHPQYVALAIIGLGTSLYWSRFIVVVAFVSMLCIYYLLARIEENVCMARFGEPYRDYMGRTGMFLPRSWEERWRTLGVHLPHKKWSRRAVTTALLIGVLAVTTGSAYWLRSHVVDSLQIDVEEARVTVFLAPVDPATMDSVTALIEDAELPGTLAYVAPSSWQIPELGFTGTTDSYQHEGSEELLHPSTHGNPLTFDQDHFSVLLVDTVSFGGESEGIDRLTRALNIRPIETVELDLVAGQVGERRPAGEGDWAGIPVPTF